MGLSKADNIIPKNIATYAPTLSDAQNATASMKYWVLGEHLYVEGTVVWSGGAAGSANFTVSLPSGYAIATTKLGGTADSTAASRAVVGQGTWYDNGTAYKPFTVETASTTTFTFVVGSILTANLFASGDGIKFTAMVPI